MDDEKYTLETLDKFSFSKINIWKKYYFINQFLLLFIWSKEFLERCHSELFVILLFSVIIRIIFIIMNPLLKFILIFFFEIMLSFFQNLLQSYYDKLSHSLLFNLNYKFGKVILSNSRGVNNSTSTLREVLQRRPVTLIPLTTKEE